MRLVGKTQDEITVAMSDVEMDAIVQALARLRSERGPLLKAINDALAGLKDIQETLAS